MAQTLQDNVKAMMAAGVPEADIEAFVQKYDAGQASAPAALPTKKTAPVAPERSFRDVLSSGVNTAAEFIPAAGAALGSIGGTPGTLLGYAGGQGIRELVQRGGEIPGAVLDIYRNLRDGDPNVRLAMLKGASQGVAQGTGNLVPGGRGTQAAISSLREGNPYTAAAQAIGAGLDVATVGASGPIRTMFTSAPVRSTMGTILGLGGAKVGEGIGGVVADEMTLTPDQRMLAETLGSIPGFAVGAGSVHPKTIALVKNVATSPVTQGLVAGGSMLATTGNVPAAIGAALTSSAANRGIRAFVERNAIKREDIASKERMQGVGIAAKKESVATKRQETLTDAATKRQEVLANAVEKVSSLKERDILLDAQKEARAQVKRENDSIINDRKTARQDELLRNALSEKKATAEGKSTEAERIREDKKVIVERHRAEDRAFEVSDTIESNLREDIHIADRTAAQDLRIHEANIKEQARATNLKLAREAANKTKRDIAYSKILTQKQKNALIAESNKATAAKQAELRRGMVGEPPIVRDSTRLKRDGVTTTTNQRFNYPEELAADMTPVVGEGQASVVQEAPGSVAPKPRVKKAAIFEEMDARASTEQAGMFPNRMGGRAVELSQDIARDRENRITEWTGEDGKPTGVDPKIAELLRLLDIMSGPESPASVQGRFAQGGTGYFGVNKQ
jgi:hypothetical protein